MNGYNADKSTDREILYWNWARITNIYKYQPLSLIKYVSILFSILFPFFH